MSESKSERPLHDYIDMEAYDVVSGEQYRALKRERDLHEGQRAQNAKWAERNQRKADAYDAARAQVKREGHSRAEYVLRAEAAEHRIEVEVELRRAAYWRIGKLEEALKRSFEIAHTALTVPPTEQAVIPLGETFAEQQQRLDES